MSQHILPGHAPDPLPPEAGDHAASINSAGGHGPQVAVADLDAGAPHLRSIDEQRLSRKALLFLACILLLVLAMGMLLLRHGRGEDVQVPRQPRTERVNTPALPSVASLPVVADALPAVEPIPVLPALPAGPVRPELPGMEQSRRPRGPSLLERRIGDGGGVSGPGEEVVRPGQADGMDDYTRAVIAQMQAVTGQAPAAANSVRRGPDVDDVSSARLMRNPDALLLRGTYLRCVLETRIVTDIAGYTSCLVTEPVYSVNGRRLLLPRGSKIQGSYGGVPGGNRVEVIWDRITTPDGIDVAMSSPGVDSLGGAGHPGHYSAHWGQRLASALMISLLSDAFKYAAAEHGPGSTTVTGSGLAVQSPYESATARTMERLAGEALGQRRSPTVTINQGTVVNVYVARDVDFSNVLPAGAGR